MYRDRETLTRKTLAEGALIACLAGGALPEFSVCAKMSISTRVVRNDGELWLGSTWWDAFSSTSQFVYYLKYFAPILLFLGVTSRQDTFYIQFFCSFVSCPHPRTSPSQFAVDYFTVLSSPKPDASDIPPAPSSDSSQRDQVAHKFYVRTLFSPFLHEWILFACIL